MHHHFLYISFKNSLKDTRTKKKKISFRTTPFDRPNNFYDPNPKIIKNRAKHENVLAIKKESTGAKKGNKNFFYAKAINIIINADKIWN